ncbi:hypothetical protein [Clostridium saudiense]|jgi:hypothetical protein|uniref:hypothetical protein n=1 Tax=Clostridium saudiense TaxID=1414720 RepID=UPI0004B7232B|nr:hypothetical protein [Clostridium saudiense]
MNKYFAYECTECGLISVYKENKDGIGCIECKGFILPIGKAAVKEQNKKVQGLSVKINVDTTELDEALEKAQILKDITEAHKKVLIIQAKALMRREDIEKEEARIKDITGMKVCIVNKHFEVIRIDTGVNNG